MHGIDEALTKFKEFQQYFEQFRREDLSESDTRSKLLDFIFIKVLGWNEVNVKREGHSDAGYYDYRLSVPGFHFLCEAKKTFEEFKLPVIQNQVLLNTLDKDKKNKEVIKQLRGYLFEEGLQYGIITNAHQFIVAKFVNSNGVNWKHNKAIVFKNLNDIETRFIDFYNLLAFDSVAAQVGFNIDGGKEFDGKTIYSIVNNPDKELIRNPLGSDIVPLLDSVFGEIFTREFSSDDAIVKECFVSNEEIKKNKSEIETLFLDLPPSLEGVIPAVNTKSVVDQIEKELHDDNISIKNPSAPNPIIIIGSKGAGKTTFIHHLFSNFSIKELKDRHPVIYLDIRKFTADDLRQNHSKIYKTLLDKLYDRYPELKLHTKKVLIRVYRKEIKRNDEGIWEHLERNSNEYNTFLGEFLTAKMSDLKNHFIKLSEYLIRERRIRVCTIFDNADQLDVETQKEAFLFSQSINSNAKCGVILSLREGYYYRWRNKPPFDAYYSHVYHITAPPYGDVLQKRIDFALEHTKIRDKNKIRGNITELSGAHVEVPTQKVITFLSSIKNSLFGKDNSEMLEFLSHTTYPNIREGLHLFKRFLVSGHTQVEQYILRHNENPKSSTTIPIYEFVKAVALDNKLIYNSATSMVHNILKPATGSSNHFIKYKLLKYLSNYSTSSTRGERFMLVSKLLSEFIEIGYKDSILKMELEDLLEFGLIESQELIADTNEANVINNEDSVSITLKGFYYLDELVNRFHYLELVAQDTPIQDKEAFEKMNVNFLDADQKGRRPLKYRKKFVEEFFSYLSREEGKEIINGGTIITGIMNTIKNKGLSKDLNKLDNRIKNPKKK